MTSDCIFLHRNHWMPPHDWSAACRKLNTSLSSWLTSVHQLCTERRTTGRGWIWQAEGCSPQPEREVRQLKEVHLTPLTSAEAHVSQHQGPCTIRRGNIHPQRLVSQVFCPLCAFISFHVTAPGLTHFPGCLPTTSAIFPFHTSTLRPAQFDRDFLVKLARVVLLGCDAFFRWDLIISLFKCLNIYT